MKKVILSFYLILSLCANVFAGDTLRLATTTSLYETGLLDYLFPVFEKKYNVKIQTISVGTGKAIKLGENGDVDVLFVHAPEAEEKFVRDGYGVRQYVIMYNNFIILGPQDDPVKINGLHDAREAFKRIYSSKATFVSRGDDSGTHKKEKEIWDKAALRPEGAWYIETGQGMGTTLRIADEKKAYVLTDRASYLFQKGRIELKKLVDSGSGLLNPYSIIAVSRGKYPHVNYELSKALIKWLISPECQKMINDYKINNEQLFYPPSQKTCDVSLGG